MPTKLPSSRAQDIIVVCFALPMIFSVEICIVHSDTLNAEKSTPYEVFQVVCSTKSHIIHTRDELIFGNLYESDDLKKNRKLHA